MRLSRESSACITPVSDGADTDSLVSVMVCLSLAHSLPSLGLRVTGYHVSPILGLVPSIRLRLAVDAAGD